MYSGVGLKAQRPPAAPSFCSYFIKRQREYEKAVEAQQRHVVSVRGLVWNAAALLRHHDLTRHHPDGLQSLTRVWSASALCNQGGQ